MSGQLSQIMLCRMMLDRRAIEMRDGLQAESRNHRNEHRLDQKHFRVEPVAMHTERMDPKRRNGRDRGQQQTHHAQFRPDRGPGNHAGSEAEDQADRDQLQHGFVDREHQNVEQGKLRRRCAIADRIISFPASQVLDVGDWRDAPVRPDIQEAQEYRQRAKSRQCHIYWRVQFHGCQKTHGNEDQAQAENGKPHAEQHVDKLPVDRERDGCRSGKKPETSPPPDRGPLIIFSHRSALGTRC